MFKPHLIVLSLFYLASTICSALAENTGKLDNIEWTLNVRVSMCAVLRSAVKFWFLMI